MAALEYKNMGETTMRKKDFEGINLFLQSQNVPIQEWATHEHWKAIRVHGVSISYTLRGGEIISQEEANLRIPLVAKFLIRKRERGCQQRNFTSAEIETETQHIRENMRKMWYNEREDWERIDDEGGNAMAP